jgi:hypothetical protein
MSTEARVATFLDPFEGDFMAFDNHNPNNGGNDHHLDPLMHLDSTNAKGDNLHLQSLQLLGDPHLMASVTGAGKHMSAGEAATWGLAGFSLAGHESSSANQGAIQRGHEVAGRVMNTTVASEGDLAAAQAAYGDIGGNLLTNPEGSFAQANLAGAIQSAQNKLDLQRAASNNGLGDNANTVQTQFSTPAEYQAFVQQQADLKTKSDSATGTQVLVSSSQTIDRRVVSTVGNSTKDVLSGFGSYTDADGFELYDPLKKAAA